MDFSWLKTDVAGLITVVVQDLQTGQVRMVAHADEGALRATLSTRQAHFFSRSRGTLWRKGEESGHTLEVSEVWADCDADCVVYLVDPAGPSCHTQRDTCFFRRVDLETGALVEHPTQHAGATFPRLWQELLERKSGTAEKSYTRSLLDKGAVKIGEKLREEADELARAVEGETAERVVSEASDVIYHLLVGLLHRDVTLRDVEAELAKRFGVSGHDEKAGRKP